LSVPPWHITQFVFQVAPWHWAHEVVAEPPTPSRAAPWQPWQLASPAFAEKAWKPVLAWSVQAAGCPLVAFAPQGWQDSQVCVA
jgi:hypothetical protein